MNRKERRESAKKKPIAFQSQARIKPAALPCYAFVMVNPLFYGTDKDGNSDKQSVIVALGNAVSPAHFLKALQANPIVGTQKETNDGWYLAAYKANVRVDWQYDELGIRSPGAKGINVPEDGNGSYVSASLVTMQRSDVIALMHLFQNGKFKEGVGPLCGATEALPKAPHIDGKEYGIEECTEELAKAYYDAKAAHAKGQVH